MLAACEEDARDVVCLCAVRNARLRLQRRHRRRRWIISDRRGAKVKGLLPRPERVGLAPPAALPETYSTVSRSLSRIWTFIYYVVSLVFFYKLLNKIRVYHCCCINNNNNNGCYKVVVKQSKTKKQLCAGQFANASIYIKMRMDRITKNILLDTSFVTLFVSSNRLSASERTLNRSFLHYRRLSIHVVYYIYARALARSCRETYIYMPICTAQLASIYATNMICVCVCVCVCVRVCVCVYE